MINPHLSAARGPQSEKAKVDDRLFRYLVPDFTDDAIIGARYDATEIMNGVTEVLAYGTAVEVEPAGK